MATRAGAGAPNADRGLNFVISERSLLGYALTATTRRGLCAQFMGDSPEDLVRDLKREFPDFILIYNGQGPEAFGAQFFTFPERVHTDLGLALDARGTPLQLMVWETLRTIPVGEVVTYTEIARSVGASNDRGEVVQACLANRIALAIPCHRAIQDDGDIGQYRWGIERKSALLGFEALLRGVLP